MPAAPEIVEIDRIVAVVNNDVIVLSELQSRLRTVVEQLEKGGVPAPPKDVLEKQVLEQLILDRLQVQIAADTGIRIDDETLNRQIADIAGQNKLSLREFRDILERDGFDFAAFREDVRNELVKNRVQQRQVRDRVQVTARDIDNYLATQEKQGGNNPEYRLGHILVAVPDGASPEELTEARDQAEDILARLKAGANFGRTAAAESDGQQALEGGDLGWRKGGELPTLFEDVVPKLEKGGLSDVIRGPSGFHVIKLLDTRGAERLVVKQTHARHILVKIDELVSNNDARTRLRMLRSRILNGADFNELARANSQDPGSAVKGGDLGWLSPGDTVPPFEKAMDALAIGEISAPFETQFGWHILQVLERRDRDSTEEVRQAKAAQALRNRKVDEELQTWFRRIRDEAYIEYRLDE
ncbi:MAG: peptidylprolyl isomerase [Gammaproteobacteria bacterium]|nr:MAG: peptidylprolyl isomerase [Gammaproteobacteria bacterium]